MKTLITYIVISFLCFKTAAQALIPNEQEINKLVAEANRNIPDSATVKACSKLFNALINTEATKALYYNNKGLPLAKKMNWQKAISVFTSNYGQYYSNLGNYDSSMHYYQQAAEISLKSKDTVTLANIYNDMAAAAQNIKNDYATAASYSFKAIELADKMTDKRKKPLFLSNISKLYILQNDFASAHKYLNQAIEINKAIGDDLALGQNFQTKAIIYYSQNKADSSRAFFKKSAEIIEPNGSDFDKAILWSQMPLAMGNDYAAVLRLRLKADSIWNRLNPLFADAITNKGNISVAYKDAAAANYNISLPVRTGYSANKQLWLNEAERYAEASLKLSKETGSVDGLSYFSGVLAEIQEQKGDYKNAYYNYRFYSEIQDSIYSQENKNKIAKAESQREVEKANHELQLKQIDLRNQQKAVIVLIVMLGMISLIGILLFRQNRQRRKSNAALTVLNNELDKANKMKAKFFAILSHDLRSPVSRLINLFHLQKDGSTPLNPKQLASMQQNTENSAVALLETMENMLIWSKSQMENFRPEIKTILVTNLYERVKLLFNNIDKLTMSFNCQQELTIETDENLLQVIINNLTANAINAAKNNDIIIKWDAWKDNDKIKLTVTDNGPGISKDELAILLDNNNIRSGKNGLGLYLIRDIAKIIGAEISIIHASKAGTTFLISL